MGQKIKKKSRQKKPREIKFLVEFKLFPCSKIDFWPFLKLQKMEFGQKKICEIDLFDVTGFFRPGLFCCEGESMNGTNCLGDRRALF